MSITIELYRENLCKMLTKLFDEVIVHKKRYNLLIPINANHVTVNGVKISFNRSHVGSVQYYLEFNEYGQMSVLRESAFKHVKELICVAYFLQRDITELWIQAPNIFGSINDETDDYYNELFVFKII